MTEASNPAGALQDMREALIERLDPSLFEIESQTTTSDRISFLRVQRFMRHHIAAYCYLETGSHLGGSLLPHLADRRCAWIVSIDPRPDQQPDERGRSFTYKGNSTARMLENLRAHLPEAWLEKLQTFDLDAAAVPRQAVQRPVDLALIDGEHTNIAAFSDFMSLFPMLASDAVVLYHDANLITDSIQNAERFLQYAGIPFATVFLPDNVAAIGLRGMAQPLLSELASAALPKEAYVTASRRMRRTSVAAETLAEGDIDMPVLAGRLGEEIAALRGRLQAIEANPLYRASRPLRAVLSRLRGR